jgi:hypothetical protein
MIILYILYIIYICNVYFYMFTFVCSCPECRPGAPCDMCDGSCVVCDGLIEPPPLDLEALVDYQHNCSSDSLPAGSVYISGALSQSVNGIYVPTTTDDDDDEDNLLPSYVKKTYEDEEEDEGIKLEFVSFEDTWCWRITSDDGDDSGLAYIQVNEDNITLPQNRMDHTWRVNINGTFEERSSVHVRLLEPVIDLPVEMTEKLKKGKAEIVSRRVLLVAEVCLSGVIYNGHCNGHCNGYCNGYCNGDCNGYCNGHCNGHCNGDCNGHRNGHCNGPIALYCISFIEIVKQQNIMHNTMTHNYITSHSS